MNFFKLPLLATSLLLIGCGSSDKANSDIKQATTIEKAKENVKSLGAIGNFEKAFSSFQSSKMAKIPEAQNIQCEKSGTLSIEISENQQVTTITMKECQNRDEYINGVLTITEYDDNRGKFEMDNLTIKDNELTLTAKNFIEVYNDSEGWNTLNGNLDIASKCFTGSFAFKTLEKLIDAKGDTDTLESGKIELNGAVYTFNNPNVTITAGSETVTMLQSELEKKFENTTECKQ